jgi:hypothetical protein
MSSLNQLLEVLVSHHGYLAAGRYRAGACARPPLVVAEAPPGGRCARPQVRAARSAALAT